MNSPPTRLLISILLVACSKLDVFFKTADCFCLERRSKILTCHHRLHCRSHHFLQQRTTPTFSSSWFRISRENEQPSSENVSICDHKNRRDEESSVMKQPDQDKAISWHNLTDLRSKEFEAEEPVGHVGRRQLFQRGAPVLLGLLHSTYYCSKFCNSAKAAEEPLRELPQSLSIKGGGTMTKVTDPQTYSALLYTPPPSKVGMKHDSNNNDKKKKDEISSLPLLVVLHGAAKNELDVWNLANPKGEHGGLAPSLLASGQAPAQLADNFVVVVPYSFGKQSFYEDPRTKLLRFIDWICTTVTSDGYLPDNMNIKIDPNRIFLFGFSDGATVGVELLTTGRFAGGVIAAYGFTGELPTLALERLKSVPMWVFHSADDVIFPVSCSDKLVTSLKRSQNKNVRYTRYDKDQEGFIGTSVQGHSTGISASKEPQIYDWMLSIGTTSAE